MEEHSPKIATVPLRLNKLSNKITKLIEQSENLHCKVKQNLKLRSQKEVQNTLTTYSEKLHQYKQELKKLQNILPSLTFEEVSEKLNIIKVILEEDKT